MTSARFDPTGRHVFVGTSAGMVYVFNVRTKGVSESTHYFCLLFRVVQNRDYTGMKRMKAPS